MNAKRKWLLFFAAYLIIATIFPSSPSAEKPNITSESAILIDGKTGQILYEKNSDQIMYPASITKILTALLAIESGKLDETVTVSKNAREVDGTRVYLAEGEKVKLEKLVKGMMINSGNDAAVAIAEHLSGSVGAFAEEMNAFVKNELELENTNFTNPHGLFNEDHVTTAKDMASITRYAMKNETYRTFAGLKKLEWEGEEWDTTLINHHRLLLDYEFVTGGKNGYVSQSGFTLVTSASEGERELIAVTMKANSNKAAYQDTLTLLNYGFNGFSPVVFEEGTELGEVADTRYSLSKDLTLFENSSGDINLSLTPEGLIQSNNGTITSSVDSSFLASKPLKGASTSKKEVTEPAVKKAEEKDSPLNDWLNLAILFVGIGMFIMILLALFLSKRSSRNRRTRSFP